MKFKKEKAAILILSVIAVAGLTVAGIGIVNHLFPDAIDFTPEPEILSPQITGEFSYGQIPEVRKYESGLLKSLSANGNPMIHEEENDIYYLSIPRKAPGTEIAVAFEAESSDGSALSIVFEKAIDNTSRFTAENGKSMYLHVYNETQYYTAEIHVTNMPFLSIETENAVTIGTNDVNCKISVQDGDWQTNGTLPLTVSYANIHVRGASSQAFPKKAYRINLKQEDYETQNKVSLLGLRIDDDWILDAMYIDPTRMHNNLATEIWNEMTKGHYPTNNSPATKTEYVEVILNGKYVGLYDLMEPIDRKQLDVDENKGLIIKTTSWEGTYFDKYEGAPSTDIWMGFEVTFPKENVTSKSWGDFFDLLQVTADYSTDKQAFLDMAKSRVDVENVTDYWLWLTIFSLRDNRGKNLYWSTFDATDHTQKFYITPWDCDLGFGYRYGRPKGVEDGLPRQRDSYENDWMDDFKLLKRYLRHDIHGSKKLTAAKWETLSTEGNVLALSSVLDRIDQTRAYLVESGAWEREAERWPDSMPEDPDEEFDYMKDWLTNRYDWMEGRIQEMLNGL